MPETGEVKGCLPRAVQLTFEEDQYEYAPVGGLPALREKVASLYNRLYRQGKQSQYTADNVAISGGGRAALARIAASLGSINMGHFIPDYTAYEELLHIFRAFNPIPLPLHPEHGYRIGVARLAEQIESLGLGALLVSNPCNPTGQVIQGEELKEWVSLCKRLDCTCIFDEFYSHYIYGQKQGHSVSAAAYVNDVNTDPVVIVDGLTKNWRYPGWRICWTVGPGSVIEAVTSAGSFLDGGANHPLQRAALSLLEGSDSFADTESLQKHFSVKKKYMVSRLRSMGLEIDSEPQGGFYCWVNLQTLPEPLRDGMRFFEERLKEKVITVPGIFFDVNPVKRRSTSRYQSYSRLSFGPEMKVLERGLNALEAVIRKF